ncbi:MAG: ion transporter [Salibacteraceae bacterium]
MDQKLNTDKLRDKLYIIIFGTETKAGRQFDLALLWAILISTIVVMLESVRELNEAYGMFFEVAEIIFTMLFTIEYALRLWTARKPIGYATSFYGIIDFLSILPTYLSLILPAGQFLMVIRIFRLMRVFRVLKLVRFMREADALWNALKASRMKISVFLFAVINVAVIMGAIMYIVEGGENGYTSIPRSIYWAIVTMTTVGFGDIHPHTDLGQFFAVVLMVLGYGIIAIPTGIVGVEMIKDHTGKTQEAPLLMMEKHCDNCGRSGHFEDAKYCMICGAKLDASSEDV